MEQALKKSRMASQAISQRHFTMAAALVGLKIGSAGTDFKHKLLLPSCRECIPDTERDIDGHCITKIGYVMSIAVLLGVYVRR